MKLNDFSIEELLKIIWAGYELKLNISRMAKPFAGKVLAMIRTGKDRKAYKPLVSPAIPQMMENEQVNKAISDMAESEVMKRLRLYVSQAVTQGR